MKGKTHCPRCGSIQSFGQQRKEVAPGEYEIFIRCDKCRWLQVIIKGNSDTIRNTREIQRLKARSLNEPSLRKTLNRKRRKLND